MIRIGIDRNDQVFSTGLLHIIEMTAEAAVPLVNNFGELPENMKQLSHRLLGNNFGNTAFGETQFRYNISGYPDEIRIVFANYLLVITAHVGSTGNALWHFELIGEFDTDLDQEDGLEDHQKFLDKAFLNGGWNIQRYNTHPFNSKDDQLYW